MTRIALIEENRVDVIKVRLIFSCTQYTNDGTEFRQTDELLL